MSRVLVIGSGLAGLLAAVRAADAGHDVVVATKSGLEESNTRHAQGGIAAALFPDDSPELHAQDTLRAGAGIADSSAVRVLCEEGPARVRDLIRFGAHFDQDKYGLARALEAAHSRARIIYAGGDATGAEIQAALVGTLRSRRTEVHENTMLNDLVVERGRVVGATFLHNGRRLTLRSDAVILATGGAGQLYAHTTNPQIATGDGVAAAWRAGASVADLEFVQFHPTALAVPGTPLISEAVRGEGAVLVNERGVRFMTFEHPAAELAPRDVVARAISAAMAAQGGRPVSLDATALGAAFLARRFPGADAAARTAGYDWSITPIPVTPAAHYAIGGVVTDLWARTSIPGLFAVGEVARTGVHGANRLASNSLLEAAVFADRAVRALTDPVPARTNTGRSVRPAGSSHPPTGVSEVNLRIGGLAAPTPDRPVRHPHGPFDREALQRLMWADAGLERTEAGLGRAATVLDAWSRDLTEPGTVTEHENRNLIDLARLTVAAALSRTESIGSHHRSDMRPKEEAA